MTDDAPIRLSDFSLTAGGRVLIENASLTIRRGELVLLVGASGSGKSVTLSFLTGLFRAGSGVTTTGVAAVLGRDPAAGGPPEGVAVVFQDFALFDDWDAKTNVRFAEDHAKHGEPPHESIEALLGSFGLPFGARPAQMSGGQKQRLAIARALAARPRLVFYDEPTSGLDPAMSDAVAARLRLAHDRGGMTSVVVTHDLPALSPIADRIILLDPYRKSFRDVPRADVDRSLAELRGFRAPEPGAKDSPGRKPLAVLLSLAGDGLSRLGDAVLALGEGLVALVPRFPQAAWGLRFTVFFGRLVAFGAAIPFLALAGLVAGFVVSFFLFELVPYSGFTEPVLLEEITAALGFALFRVVVPGTTALLFAARGGAALAADFGRRTASRQTDALRISGIEPSRYLLGPALIASLIGAPVLWFVAWKAAALAAATVFLATHPGHGAFAFDDRFTSLVGEASPFSTHGAWSLGKTLCGVFGTVVIAWRTGLRRPDGGADLARGVTRSVVRSILWVLFVQLVFAFLEFAPAAAKR